MISFSRKNIPFVIFSRCFSSEYDVCLCFSANSLYSYKDYFHNKTIKTSAISFQFNLNFSHKNKSSAISFQS